MKVAVFNYMSITGAAYYSVYPPISGADIVVAKHYDGEAATGLYPAFKTDAISSLEGVHDTAKFLERLGYDVSREGEVPPRANPTSADMVREFHNKFGHPVSNIPHLISWERAQLRYDLIREELAELMDAITGADLVKIADALADLNYVVNGAALEFGIPLRDATREAHRSNMTKLGENGLPVYRDDGKVLKGPNFEEPDFESVLRNAGWDDA